MNVLESIDFDEGAFPTLVGDDLQRGGTSCQPAALSY
jgi:hypothetical protein